MPCVAFYLILMHLNSGFLHKDPVVSGLIYSNQKLVVSELCFQKGCGGKSGVFFQDGEKHFMFSQLRIQSIWLKEYNFIVSQ